MKTILAASALAAALAGCATPYAPQDFDFSEFSSGTVESVRAVPLDIHAFEAAVVHSINPQTEEELRILLDNGRAVTVTGQGARRFAPGERVRIVADRIERE